MYPIILILILIIHSLFPLIRKNLGNNQVITDILNRTYHSHVIEF